MVRDCMEWTLDCDIHFSEHSVFAPGPFVAWRKYMAWADDATSPPWYVLERNQNVWLLFGMPPHESVCVTCGVDTLRATWQELRISSQPKLKIFIQTNMCRHETDVQLLTPRSVEFNLHKVPKFCATESNCAARNNSVRLHAQNLRPKTHTCALQGHAHNHFYEPTQIRDDATKCPDHELHSSFLLSNVLWIRSCNTAGHVDTLVSRRRRRRTSNRLFCIFTFCIVDRVSLSFLMFHVSWFRCLWLMV